ncbi:hypothetical protein BDZ94DRAFT_1295128 [Collybia nuda]|uniref:F-box domain-containing protein n=1 Tax=Collybia nuda TaxID=64659 RepID=A0A9P5YEU4_9AGAR|nr:hypothetical protein BDZ94DRAFT_1295128 [Collybia nuda]
MSIQSGAIQSSSLEDLVKGITIMSNIRFSYDIGRSEYISLVSTPPVPRLLHSNDPPTEIEASLIRRTISQVEHEASLMENPWLTARNQQALAQRRVHYAQFIGEQRSLLSPLRHFPSEIFSEIFIHYRICVDESLPPMLLAHICRRWRVAALSTSQLWCTLPTLDLDSARGRDPRFIEILRSYMSWSGALPLTLHLYNTVSTFSSHPILDAIIPHSPRWRNVNLDVNTASFAAYTGIRGKLAALHTLKIRLHAEPSFEPMAPSDLFALAPNLREVSVEGEGPQDWLILPWHQLARFSGKLKQAPRILRAAPQLMTCELSAVLGHPMVYRPFDPVTLHLLQSLSLHSDWGSVHSPQLLDNLILPNLEVFRFRGPSFLVNSCISTFSSCSLRSLTLYTSALQGGDFPRLLVHTPLLTDLDVDTCGMPWNVAIPLIFSPDQPPLVPALLRLTFRTHDIQDHIVAVIKSRCDFLQVPNPPHTYSVARLECARIVFRSPIVCRSAQDYLEAWSGKNHPESGTVVGWNNHLNNILLGKKIPDQKKLQSVHSIFSTIENYGTIYVENLRLSRLHILMRRISLSPRVPGDESYKFRTRAAVLLEQWTPALFENAKTCRWITEGDSDLVYVPESDIQGYGHELLTLLVFGRTQSRDCKWERTT